MVLKVAKISSALVANNQGMVQMLVVECSVIASLVHN